MKSFENVYKELEYLLIQKLPESIEKINKEHNDGIILKPFENKSLEENCIKTPSFTFDIEETEYSEKDRIIENTIYTISLKIKIHPNSEKQIIILMRYIESIEQMINENTTFLNITLKNINHNKVQIKIMV